MRTGGRLQLLIDKLDQVIAYASGVVVKLTYLLRRGPLVPPKVPVHDWGVVLAIEFGAILAFSFEVVEVL